MVGNCQARGVATCMRLLLPRAAIQYHPVFGLARRFRDAEDFGRELADVDLVFASPIDVGFRDGGRLDALLSELRAVGIPILVFPAFHPDLVYVTDRADRAGRGLIQSAVGDYHSALALFGYQEGLSPAETRNLFDAAIYRRLGYLDLWDSSASALLEAGRQAGHDLAGPLLRWSRRGAFMHSSNHPKMYVAADLARLLLTASGLEPAPCDLDAFAADEFIRQGTWPVYRPIAEHYGVPGSDLFLTQAIRTRAAPRTMDLDGYLTGTFARFGRHGRSDFGCPRVEAWRADPAIWSDLRAAAGR